MTSARGILVILLLALCLGGLATAEDTSVYDSDLSSIDDFSALFSGMDSGSLDLDSLFSGDLISGILGILLALFLSFLGISFT